MEMAAWARRVRREAWHCWFSMGVCRAAVEPEFACVSGVVCCTTGSSLPCLHLEQEGATTDGEGAADADRVDRNRLVCWLLAVGLLARNLFGSLVDTTTPASPSDLSNPSVGRASLVQRAEWHVRSVPRLAAANCLVSLSHGAFLPQPLYPQTPHDTPYLSTRAAAPTLPVWLVLCSSRVAPGRPPARQRTAFYGSEGQEERGEPA
jgi:hypothetical protein